MIPSDSFCYQYRCGHVADGLLLSGARFLVRLHHKISFFDMKYKNCLLTLYYYS